MRESALHLREEPVCLEPQADDVDPEDTVTAEHHVVLSEVVACHGEAPTVLRSIDLHDEVVPVPHDVEVGAASRRLPNHLSRGFREAASSTEPGEVQLSEALDPEGDVADHCANEGSARTPADEALGCREPSWGREPLLDGHEQDEGGLPVGGCPVRRADCRDLWPRPRQA